MKNALAMWIWLCAWLNCAGWLLSAIHQLNATGYLVVLAIAFVVFWVWKRCDQSRPSFSSSHKLLRRFGRPFPFAFLILSIMAFVGGALHAPNNYDGLTYRVPRVLHWLAAGQWLWIHTPFPRVNASSCGIEWLSAPLIALFQTDRLLFLINFISFLFLPGLTFSVLTRLGVRHRVAWYWMWIAPTGYCFLLQAGSIGNDAFAAPFALAAIDFALRAKASRRPGDLFCSLLAAALLTGTKFANIPLLLPWAIALFPSLSVLLKRPMATVLVCALAFSASFLPKAILNEHFCHDWSGVSLENDQTHGSMFVRFPANVVLTSLLNLSPPVFPQADRWNQFVQNHIPPGLSLKLQRTMTEPGAYEFLAPQMQIEENAGLGFGVTLLLLASVLIVVVHRGKALFQFRLSDPDALWRAGVVLAPWVSTLTLLTQSEVYPIGRILAPNYILLLPLLLAPAGHELLVRKTLWRGAAFIVFAMAAGLLIISPARPLFPVGMLLNKLSASHSQMATRTADVYTVYRDRNHAFQPVLDILPPGVKTLGFITYDDPETALWQPFGSRTVIHICPGDGPDFLKTNGITYILAKENRFGKQFPDFDTWRQATHTVIVQPIPLNLQALYGTNQWDLLKVE